MNIKWTWLFLCIMSLNHHNMIVSGLMCYACFYNEEKGFGVMCKTPYEREHIVKCKNQEDFQNSLNYTGATYKAESGAEGQFQYVCAKGQGDFKGIGLARGLLRTCWRIPKTAKKHCGKIKFAESVEAVNGCFCDDNKSGLPCNDNGKSLHARHADGSTHNVNTGDDESHHGKKQLNEDDGDGHDHHGHKKKSNGLKPFLDGGLISLLMIISIFATIF